MFGVAFCCCWVGLFVLNSPHTPLPRNCQDLVMAVSLLCEELCYMGYRAATEPQKVPDKVEKVRAPNEERCLK